MIIKQKAYINGEFINSTKKSMVEIISPLDQKVMGIVPALSKQHIELAFKSAKNVFHSWKNTPIQMRKKYINKFVQLLEQNVDEIAKVMTIEIGKSIEDSKTEIIRSVEYINKTIAEYDKIHYEKMEIDNFINHKYLEPLGVVLAISPYNYPINLSISKIIPALLSGNVVVFKAATNGSVACALLASLFHDANFPKGVFNYVTGRGRDIGDILISNANIDMISFTGSVGIGQRISTLNPSIPKVLELGGNDLAYVKDDADLHLAAKQILKGAFSFSGQRCTAIKRLALSSSIVDKFLDIFIPLMKNLKIVPIIDQKSVKYIKDLYDDAIKNGGKILANTFVSKEKLNFLNPQLILTTINSKLWVEEQFGPILPLVILEDETKLLDIINGTNFGLQNSIFTKDINWALEISKKIESGTVNINRASARTPDEFPFLGIKNSGMGVQGIKEAIISMTRIKNIVVA